MNAILCTNGVGRLWRLGWNGSIGRGPRYLALFRILDDWNEGRNTRNSSSCVAPSPFSFELRQLEDNLLSRSRLASACSDTVSRYDISFRESSYQVVRHSSCTITSGNSSQESLQMVSFPLCNLPPFKFTILSYSNSMV